MFRRKTIILVLAFLLLLTHYSSAETKDTATITRIVDGDTIVVLINNGEQKVRLIGIDTPETVHPKKSVEHFGKEATAYTTKFLLGKTVFLTYDWQKYDYYNRLLAYVWVDGKLFNLQIIKDGYAHAYLKYPFRDEYMKSFREAQTYARKHKLGLWK